MAFLLWIFAPVIALFVIIRVIPIFVILIFFVHELFHHPGLLAMDRSGELRAVDRR
ncbi:MAG: hypothetical protein MZV49_15605 [Rhodopseudomonas palustris]|nr:hypothetical protein [Rhodopseudomonas palustris]